MREKIDITEALRLYHVWRSWREVAVRLVRANGMCFTTDAALIKAVRRYDRRSTKNEKKLLAFLLGFFYCRDVLDR